jgi:hypothetical protein
MFLEVIKISMDRMKPVFMSRKRRVSVVCFMYLFEYRRIIIEMIETVVAKAILILSVMKSRDSCVLLISISLIVIVVVCFRLVRAIAEDRAIIARMDEMGYIILIWPWYLNEPQSFVHLN